MKRLLTLFIFLSIALTPLLSACAPVAAPTQAPPASATALKDLTEEVAAATQGAIAIEDQILEALGEKGFSRSSVSDTAEELGGLNRGTVAEYLRGQCLKAFVEQGFRLELAANHVSLSADAEVNDRVKKKLREYRANISQVVDPSKPWDEVKTALRPKTKNIPQRYHGYIEQVADAYYRGMLRIDSDSCPPRFSP